MVDWAVTCT